MVWYKRNKDNDGTGMITHYDQTNSYNDCLVRTYAILTYAYIFNINKIHPYVLISEHFV